MSRSGSLHQAKGGNFTKKLLYVQHVDKEKDTASTISEQSLHEYFLGDSKIFSDSNFAEYLRNPKANVDILKSSLQDEIVIGALVCTNPLPAIPVKTAVTFHAFVVFKTENSKTKNGMWYSMEKNGQYIVLQQSPNDDDVEKKLYDPVEKKLVQRQEPVEQGRYVTGNEKELEYLLRAIWNTKQLSTTYNLLFSNCQNFAEFVFEEASFGGMKWSTWISAFVDRIGLSHKKSQTEIEADTLDYNRRKDAKFVYYKAMAEGRRQDFEELAGNLTNESLNSVDSQGYTLLEWATVFSTSDWPIDQFLIKKGAETPADEGKFRRNVFFIALQYLLSNKESRYLSFDGIDIHGVIQTGDSALHLALYGEKWDVAERILDQFPDYDVNVTNSSGYTPLHLALQLQCKMVLIKKILARMNSENVNVQNENGWTALHDAIMYKYESAVKELLKRDDVDVNLKNKYNLTALYYACCLWKNIPIDLFTKIFEKSTDVNAQARDGNTALHLAIMYKSATALQELLKRKDIDVKLKDNKNQTTLHRASWWEDMPIELFRLILEKTANINAQDKDGDTALHWAIGKGRNRAVVEELLKRDDVDVNLKNNQNLTALHFAANKWKDMPIDFFRVILEKSTDVNAQERDGNTALHLAATALKELLKCKEIDFNIKNNKNETALYLACWWNDMPIYLFKIILEKSADIINAQDEDGDSALHLAIALENRTAVEELLKRDDVDVNLRNKYNQTALHLACFWKNIPVEMFRKILEKSSDVNAQEIDGLTALHIAINFQLKGALEELLKRKDVDVNLKNKYNQTALHYYAAFGWKNMPRNLFTKIFKKSTDVNAQDKNGFTALHFAILGENRTAVEELLKCKDVDFNIKNYGNQTALYLSCKWKNIPVELFRVILEKSTNVNAQDEVGTTALHWATFKQSTTAVEELIKHKDVDVNLKNNKNQTALHCAAVAWKNMPIKLFTKILEKTTDVNAQEEDGRTALHWAIKEANKTAVGELLKCKDVDFNIKNNNDRTALFIACFWKNMPIDLFRLILEKTTDVNAQEKDGHSALQCALSEGNETVVGELLKCKDVDVNLKNNDNQTALHFSCLWEDMPIDLFRVILEKTANINEQTENGHTALRLAIRQENRTAVEELLNHKDVDVNLKNNDNQTALHYAAWWKNMPTDLFRVILEKSANINEQDKDGDTALHWATFKQSTTAVEELLKHKDVDVNLKNNKNQTALHCAAVAWKNMPIKKKKTDDGITEDVLRLHFLCESKKRAIRKRRERKNVDVNQMNNNNISFFFRPLFVLFSLLLIYWLAFVWLAIIRLVPAFKGMRKHNLLSSSTAYSTP
jgi:ankyrin repeat protein